VNEPLDLTTKKNLAGCRKQLNYCKKQSDDGSNALATKREAGVRILWEVIVTGSRKAGRGNKRYAAQTLTN